MPKKQQDIAIGAIQKRDDSEIRATLTHFRGELYVDLREYVETESYQGPTKRGIRFHVENWESFKELIASTDEWIQKEMG